MRRIVAGLLFGALAFACCPKPGAASLAPALRVPIIDLRSQILLQLYGETGDSAMTLAASFGDAVSESPLRRFAFRLAPPDIPQFELPAVASLPAAHLDLSRYVTATFEPTAAPVLAASAAPSASPSALSYDASPAPAFGLYRGEAAQPTSAPGNVRFQLSSPSGSPNASSYAPAAPMPDTLGQSAATATVNVPVRVGPVNFQGRVEGGSSFANDSSLKSNAYGAGANFNVQAGKRAVNVDVASRFEHVTRNDTPLTQSVDGASSWQLSNDNLPILVPAFADVSKHTLSAGLAVPVSRRLTAGVQYDTQHLLGGYGAPGLNNLDANNTVYGAKLTYQLHSGSAITFSAKQYRYQDNLLPTNTFLTTREDVNLTVKF